MRSTPTTTPGENHPRGESVGHSPCASVAFFDLDGTLVTAHTQALLVKFFSEMGIVSRAFVFGTAMWFLGYKAGLVRVTQRSRAKGASVLKGLTIAEVDRLMTCFAEEAMAPRLHPSAVAALHQHAAEGDRVVVLSAALEPVVKALCSQLGVTEYAGARCRLGSDRYTGGIVGSIPYGELKARIAARFMRRWEADPADCWAYADHETDLFLLRSVGHPVAVRPRPRLLQVARDAGWPVIP